MMKTTTQPSIPAELWGLWMPHPTDGEPRWLVHTNGMRGDGPMVFFDQKKAEYQAREESCTFGDVVLAVRLLCMTDPPTSTP
jgi:hypothetical protein